MRRDAMRRALLGSVAATALAAAAAGGARAQDARFFERVSTLPVYLNLPEGADPASQTVAEIVAATPDGMTLIYTDSPGERVGMVDIADPSAPRPAGAVALGGEPTSVATAGGLALVAVSTGESKKEPAGHVALIDLAGKAVVGTCDVRGQPDSAAVSRDGRFLAVVVENERDEELDDGKIPQPPPGHLAIFDLGPDGRPANCDAARVVALTGLAGTAPDDPEPEFVDINGANLAAVTLQENNHIALVDLASGRVTGHFPAGTVDLERIDADGDAIIAGTGAKRGVPREPDAVAWLDDGRLAVANEGDYQGGSRGFTIFDTAGEVLHESGNLLEHLAMRHGHYPVKRAKSKGVEPEGVEFARFGDAPLLVVSAERANFAAVFEDKGAGAAPELLQFLPTGVGPEGLLAIPSRGLLVVATEVDSAEDNVRAGLGIFARTASAPAYPTIVSADDPATGAPIGWGALSGLAADPGTPGRLHAVSDSYYGVSRVYTIDAAAKPARITAYLDVRKDGAPAAYDLEGIAPRSGGGFWLASEGDPESKNPLAKASLLLAVAADGTVEKEIGLPDALAARAVRFGFEGVAAWGEGADERVVVAVQREWKDDPKGTAKLAVYAPATGAWGFVRYPLEAPSSPAGGWVGLSEITHLGGGRFAVLERDNQPGPAAALKTIAVVSLAGVEPQPYGRELPLVEKRRAIDLLPALRATKGWTADKPEGFAVTADGRALMVTDNDGVEDATGETLLIDVGGADALR